MFSLITDHKLSMLRSLIQVFFFKLSYIYKKKIVNMLENT